MSAPSFFRLALWALLAMLCLLTATGAHAQNETVTYIHTDGLGSPIARSDAAGNVISRTRYEPYGLTAAGDVPSIGFTGHVNDADTGLVYMQQRYYDPVAGRFLSIDPVTADEGTGGNFNRYSYANNNPYRYVDPDGRWPRLLEAKVVQNLQTILTIAAPEMSANEKSELTLSAKNFINGNYSFLNIMDASITYTEYVRTIDGAVTVVQVGFSKEELEKLSALQKKMEATDPKAAARLKAAIEGGMKNGTVLVDGKRVNASETNKKKETRKDEPKKEEPKKKEPVPNSPVQPGS
jgi:RHS repeat-associated protein